MYRHLQVKLSLFNGLLNKVTAVAKVLKGVFLFLLLFAFQNSFSQTYPITSSFQIIPPYNVYLPDYCVPGSDKIRVILLQNDLTVPAYEVRLRMTVEWNGSVIMRTSPNFSPRPITLSAGVPNLVSGDDLCVYFATDAIDFTGYNRENYERTKTLPEGAYRISFTAYDYRRQNVQVSNVGSNIFFLQKKDPPLLNSPSCSFRIAKLDPQFITFNWSSVNTPSLPGNETEYTFSLYEIKPKNSDPNFIIRSSAPIHTAVTSNNFLPYGLGEPALLDDMEYVWRVQARSSDGRDLYANQGYSRPCKFSYGGVDPFHNLPRPTVFAKPLHERAAMIWCPPARQQNLVEGYRIEYRGSTNSMGEFPWHTEEKESDTTFNISSLEPEREYEVRSSWKVHGVYGPYSEVVKFTTPKPKKFECGADTAPTVPTNQTPLQSAEVGMTVKMGNLDITLLEVSGSNGTFSGKGKIANKGFLHGLRMLFSNIFINTDLVVTRGEMQADAEPIEAYVGEKVEKQRKVDTYKKFGGKIPDGNTPLPELQEFAKALIEIPQDRIDKAIALTREEKQQVETAREKAKFALKTLNDPKATAQEKTEAERNLRKAVADAKPALTKLANTLDRGIQTVVGRWFKRIMDFLNAYKGDEADKKQAIVWHNKMDSTVNVLSNRKDVPATLKKAMVDAHQNARTAWANLEKGTDGVRPRGPSADFEEGHTPEDIVLCKTNAEKAEVVEKYLGLPKPKVNCVSSNANLGKIFKAPDGTNVALGADDIPLAFFASEEGDLYGRLASFKRNNIIYFYNYRRNDWNFKGTWQVYESNNSATEDIRLSPANSEGRLVKLTASGECPEQFRYYFTLGGTDVVGGRTGEGYLFDLDKEAGKGYRQDPTSVSASASHFYNYAIAISNEEKEKIIAKLKTSAKNTGVEQKIFFTDYNTPADKKQEIENYLNSLSGEIVLWIDFEKNKNPTIKIKVGNSIRNANTLETNKFIQKLAEILPTCKQDGNGNPLTLILDGLAGLIGKLSVSEKYYNPNAPDYNSFPATVYGLTTGRGFSSIIGDLSISAGVTNICTATRCEFAFACGIWNGTVELLGGIPDGTSQLIKIVVNQDNKRDIFIDKVYAFQFKDLQKVADTVWTQCTGNACMINYCAGKGAFLVISCFIGVGELGVAGRTMNVLDKLDVMGQLMSKAMAAAFKLSGKLLKPIAWAGKIVFEPLLRLAHKESAGLLKYMRGLIKRNNRVILSLHASENGKFLVDGVEKNGEELGQLLGKKNLKDKEIVLLSCNDLEAAKGLAEYTGAKVYTTNGTLTLFDNGVRRAEGSDWYKIEPSGAQTKLQEPPVTECVNCSGEGVVMGGQGLAAGGDLTQLLLNSGEDFILLTNARKLPGSITGSGKTITGKWLRGTEGNAGLFPKSVADKLRGKTFSNFDEFRQAFWKEVANDPALATQFSPKDIAIMKNGLAPEVLESQRVGGKIKYILHHKTPINKGGDVYDMDNLYIVTPKYHKEILAPPYHYGYGY